MDNDINVQAQSVLDQIQSLESLPDLNDEITNVLNDLRACYDELKTVQEQLNAQSHNVDTVATVKGSTVYYTNFPLKCNALSVETSQAALNLQEKQEDLSRVNNVSRVFEFSSRLCPSTHIEDPLFLQLCEKAQALLEHDGFLDLAVSRFIWGAYLYHKLASDQVILYATHQLNGSHTWRVARVMDLTYEAYSKSDIKALAENGTLDTLPNIERGVYPIEVSISLGGHTATKSTSIDIASDITTDPATDVVTGCSLGGLTALDTGSPTVSPLGVATGALTGALTGTLTGALTSAPMGTLMGTPMGVPMGVPMGSSRDVSNVLSTGSDIFLTVSTLHVILITPLVAEEVPCRYAKQGCFRKASCRFKHGEFVEPNDVRLVTPQDIQENIKVGCPIVYKDTSDEFLWKRGLVSQKTDDFISVMDRFTNVTHTLKDAECVLPDFALWCLDSIRLPGDEKACHRFVYEKEKLSEVDDGVVLLENENTSNLLDKTVETSSSYNPEAELSLCDVDTFGAWEKYTKGFGLRMLIKMGYKKGDALSPPSWKPTHRPKLVEPLDIRILTQRAGLDFASKGRRVEFKKTSDKGFEKREKRRREMEANSSAFGIINHVLLASESELEKRKIKKDKEMLEKTRKENKSESELRHQLIKVEQQEMTLIAEIRKLEDHLEKRKGVKGLEALMSRYHTELLGKKRKLCHLKELSSAIGRQLKKKLSCFELNIF